MTQVSPAQVYAVLKSYEELDRFDFEFASAMAREISDLTKEVKVYKCPTCGSNDPNKYVRCNHAGCPDGRDPR